MSFLTTSYINLMALKLSHLLYSLNLTISRLFHVGINESVLVFVCESSHVHLFKSANVWGSGLVYMLNCMWRPRYSHLSFLRGSVLCHSFRKGPSLACNSPRR